MGGGKFISKIIKLALTRTMPSVPENAASGCPGVESEDAGKASACAGCPNQNVCSSGSTPNDDHVIDAIRNRLSQVKTKILVLSGKGGVGKSTLTTLLARTFAKKKSESNFGVLDVDICGPSQPRMFGVAQESVHQSGSGWSPVYVDDNLCLMSLGFLLASPDDAIIWRGPKKNGIIRQFLSEVDWGSLDCLFLDTPPGTSDEHLSSISYLTRATTGIGAVIVTTPQEVSLLDVRKQITFCRKMKIPIIGVIENMSSFLCGHCSTVSEIFPSKTGGAKRMCEDLDIDYLGSVPLNVSITKNCDKGEDFTNLDDVTLNILSKIVDLIDSSVPKLEQ